MANTHLFVDTNVFLDFYSYAKDDLSQLMRLIELLRAGKITLHLPSQVLNELERNRETKLKASADQFRKDSMPTAIPRHMQDYPFAKVYQESVDAAIKARVAMINQAATEAASRTLAADKALEELIRVAMVYLDSEEIFSRAIQRMQKGNPPGKPGSVGDQYNWEILLRYVPDKCVLHLVSKDGDFSSGLNTGHPHPFLEKEWLATKNASLHVYSELRPFLDQYVKQLKEEHERRAEQERLSEQRSIEFEEAVQQCSQTLSDLNNSIQVVKDICIGMTTESKADENEKGVKTIAINDLTESASFADTHSAIAKLEEFRATITDEEAEELLNAAINNNQISWIASDSDVFSFFTAILSEHPCIRAELIDEASSVFGLKPDDEDQDPDR